MPKKFLDFAALRQISAMDEAYACRYHELDSFYKYPPELGQFAQIASDKSRDNLDRDLLVKVLRSQYEKIGIQDEDQLTLIDKLREDNCFTITTAHQPSLLTGPLYYIYKGLSTKVLADKVAGANPDLHIQPLFIVGGEDHDFAEINHCYLGKNRIEWSRTAQGSVGRLSLTSLKEVLSNVQDMGSSTEARTLLQALNEFEQSSDTYGTFAVRLTQFLFGRYGILVLNMDDRRLKQAMIPHFQKEIVERPSLTLVQEAQKSLIDSGFSTQAFPRAINLFYLTDSFRERIEMLDGKYYVLNTNLEFTETEILRELEAHPERFSPNVILRPIYQEAILPNLAYVGGGGELAYWLERKSQFAHFGINLPMLVRRDSALWVDSWSQRKLDKWGLTLEDISLRHEQLINAAVGHWSSSDYNIDEELEMLAKLFEKLRQKATHIDPSLAPMVNAQHTYHDKKLKHLGGKIRKAEKAKYHRQIMELTEVTDRLFPGGNLQERRQNFLPIFSKEGFDFFEKLINQFDPLDSRIKVIYE